MCGGGRWVGRGEKKPKFLQDAGQERQEEEEKKNQKIYNNKNERKREKGNLNLETKEPETCVRYFTDGT